MRRSLTERVFEKVEAQAFYSRYTQLSKATEKGECKGLCPLHREKTPSFFVNLKTGLFHCFGCGSGGGPLQFYASYHGFSTLEAKVRLAGELELGGAGRWAGQRVRQPKTTSKRSQRREQNSFDHHSQEETFAAEKQCLETEIYSTLLEAARPAAHAPRTVWIERAEYTADSKRPPPSFR